ncbi:fibronectin type III domain-containing protein [Cryomorphaceae bacterium 1068]|nr:fibronectin type III domain-containing protein [Cryomorphaceae bacterium 1068]
MSEQYAIGKNEHSLQVRCISALRSAREGLHQKNDRLDALLWSVERLENELFSAEQGSPGFLLECYIDLIFILKGMEKSFPTESTPMRPIGLQVATANNILPIHLEWNYHDPNSLFVIEYANFEEANKPEWQVYSKTRSTSFTVRGLQKGQAYWFRISALATAM